MKMWMLAKWPLGIGSGLIVPNTTLGMSSTLTMSIMLWLNYVQHFKCRTCHAESPCKCHLLVRYFEYRTKNLLDTQSVKQVGGVKHTYLTLWLLNKHVWQPESRKFFPAYMIWDILLQFAWFKKKKTKLLIPLT